MSARILVVSILGALSACTSADSSVDLVYARGADTLIACANGGMVATTAAAGTVQGYFDRETDVGTVGASGAVELALTAGASGALTDANGAWSPIAAAPDTATQCAALEEQPWWTATPHRFAQATAFASPVFPSQAACDAAHADGSYPAGGCYYELLLCADGTASELLGDVGIEGTYTVDDGTFTLSSSMNDYGSTATYWADGTLTWAPQPNSNVVPNWTTMPPDGPIADYLDCPND